MTAQERKERQVDFNKRVHTLSLMLGILVVVSGLVIRWASGYAADRFTEAVKPIVSKLDKLEKHEATLTRMNELSAERLRILATALRQDVRSRPAARVLSGLDSLDVVESREAWERLKSDQMDGHQDN